MTASEGRSILGNNPSSQIHSKSTGGWLPHTVLWLMLATAIICYLVLPGFTNPRFGFDPESRSIVDFPSHFNFAQRAWAQQAVFGTSDSRSIYSVSNHLKVTGDWAGRPMQVALPFGYSPTMLLLLGPALKLRPIWAYCLWTLLGLVCVWWLTRPGNSPWGIGILFFLNPLTIGVFFLGQTALLSMTGILALSRIADYHRASIIRALISRREVFAAILLWTLTAKPPLALACGVALVCTGRWKIVCMAVIITLATTLALTPWLGPGWAADYFGLVTHYNRDETNPAFAWSLVPAHMANLRGLLGIDAGVRDLIASRVSLAIWGVALASIFIYARRCKPLPNVCWSLAILSYLCFCPHVTSTEELHLYLLLILLAFRFPSRIDPIGWVLIVGLILLPYLSPAFHPGVLTRSVLFIAKLGLIPVALVRK